MNRNTLGDLNGYLFEQMERLNDPELSKEELKNEISRAQAITKVSAQIINNGNLVLKAQVAYDNMMDIDAEKPTLLEG